MPTLENHVRDQAKNNKYDLEANLAVLKLYQFNPHMSNLEITYLILLKALTSFPHTDFTLCKCLLLPAQMNDDTVNEIISLADILEKCDFELFWSKLLSTPDLVVNVNGFFDSIRKYVCHVVGITFQTIASDYLVRLLGGVDSEFLKQIIEGKYIELNFHFSDQTLSAWMKKYGWKNQGDLIYVASQDANIKTKNITEKIEFENLSNIMTSACL